MFSIGIDVLYRHTYVLRYELPQNVWILPEITDKYEIVKLGNSHSDEGITFERYRLKTLSLASVSQSFEYDLASLKMHSRQIKDGAVIIINASPMSFSQGKPGREDSLQTKYYDGRLSPFLIPNLKVEDYLQSQFLPFLRTGFLWRDRHNKQIRDRIAVEEKRPDPAPKVTVTADKEKPLPVKVTPTPVAAPAANAAASTDFNTQSVVVAKDPGFQVSAIQSVLSSPPTAPTSMHVDSMNFIFNKWLLTSGFGTQYFESNSKDLEKLIDYCLKKKWRPVLITIPVSKVLLKGLGDTYMQKYVYDNIDKTNLQGINYFDFTQNEQLTKNSYLFNDSDHLNQKGAVIVSYLLLRSLVDNGYLPNEVDGYDYNP